MKVEGTKVFDRFGLNLYKDFESYICQKTIHLPLSNGVCLLKLISKYQFPAHKITIQN